MASNTFDFTDFIAERVPPGRAPVRVARPQYDFAVGYPDPDSFPADGLHEALGRALKDHGRDLVLYPHLQGLPALREFIAEKLRRERGMRVDADQVVLTGGSGPAIAMFTQLFTDPGDTILTEYFTYLGALGIMRGFAANIVGVAMDEEGMRPDALDEAIQDLKRRGKRPKFIYTIPSFQNPVGTDRISWLWRKNTACPSTRTTATKILDSRVSATLRSTPTMSPGWCCTPAPSPRSWPRACVWVLWCHLGS